MTTTMEAPPDESAAQDTAGTQQPPAASTVSGTLVSIGLNEATVQRITDGRVFEVSTEIEAAATAQLVAISTRTGRGRSARIPNDLDPASAPPIVVVCHPGGEETALDLMRQGCAGVVAEGNEAALVSYLDSESHSEMLVEGYLEDIEKGRGGGTGRHRDPVTNLPEVASFEVRLGEFVEAGNPPSVVIMQITNLEEARNRTDSRAINLLRRRLACAYGDIARQNGCEVFSLGESTFAIVDGAHRLNNTRAVGDELIELTEAFRPAGIKLRVAIGAVFATAHSEVRSLREQAEQAVMAAAQAEESAFVTAEEVTVLLASATEYKVAQMLVSVVDKAIPNPDGHSSRVAELASDMGREIGYQGRELSNLRLAALLHDIGKIQLSGADTDHANDAQDFADRGARYVLASAGTEIADAIRYQQERWDGSGPNGLAEDDIPLEARVIALADAADTWLRPPDPADAVSPSELIERIQAESGGQFDPTLVDTALRLFGGA